MGSPLKVYIENIKKEILDRSWNEYDDLPKDFPIDVDNIETLKIVDKTVWVILENIEAICKKRGRY